MFFWVCFGFGGVGVGVNLHQYFIHRILHQVVDPLIDLLLLVIHPAFTMIVILTHPIHHHLAPLHHHHLAHADTLPTPKMTPS